MVLWIYIDINVKVRTTKKGNQPDLVYNSKYRKHAVSIG